MRPNALEAIRGIQEALLSNLAPELQTMFAQDMAQTMQMLMESVAGEWDAAADTLASDNRRLGELLSLARDAIRSLPGERAELTSLAQEIGGLLDEPAEESLAISRLSARNERLRALLERTIVAIEDAQGQPELAPLASVREEIYRHLREVAARGWSFWDVFSFRERMARLRASQG